MSQAQQAAKPKQPIRPAPKPRTSPGGNAASKPSTTASSVTKTAGSNTSSKPAVPNSSNTRPKAADPKTREQAKEKEKSPDKLKAEVTYYFSALKFKGFLNIHYVKKIFLCHSSFFHEYY